MNVYAYILGVAVLMNVVIGLAVLALGPRRRLNRFFAIAMLGFAVWGFGVYIARFSTDRQTVILGMNIAAVGWCFVGTLYLHFVLILTGRDKILKNIWSYFMLYVPPAILLLLVWFTDLTHKNEAIMHGNFRPTPAFAFSHIVQAYTIGMFALSLLLLIIYWKSSVRHFSKRNEIYFILLCFITAVTATFTEVILPIFGIYTFDIPIFVAGAITPLIAYGLVTRGFVMSLETALGEAITKILYDPVILIDYKGMIEHANPAALKLTGYSEKEIYKISFDKIFDVRGIVFSSEILEDTPTGNKELGRCVTKEGEWIPVEVSWAALYYGGLMAGLIVVAHDMKDAFELIQAEEKARVATVEAKAQRKLTGNLREIINLAAHELRHPAAAIKGSTMLLDNYFKDEKDPSVQTAVNSLEAAAERLARLANELSDMSHIEGKGFQLYYSESEPKELVENAVQEVKSRHFPVDIAISGNGDGKSIQADIEKIEEVLSILIDNAVKFSPEGSEVRVWWKQNDKETAFYVADRGPGISRENREKIFDRFYEVEGPLNHSLPGMGLGLYIAKTIVDAHGGGICVDEREGGGSVFSFTVPVVTFEED